MHVKFAKQASLNIFTLEENTNNRRNITGKKVRDQTFTIMKTIEKGGGGKEKHLILS